MTGNLIKEQLKHLPANPGVYLMKDTGGRIIYVGKASDLKNRVRSYFQGSSKLAPKTKQLVEEVHELEFFITNSEYEALILENNLIKRYKPHYNIRLKDDKGFPYIKISLAEEWPVVSYTRKFKNDGARYFGPFTDAKAVKQTLKILVGIFRFRTCSKNITGNDKRPCLKYYLGHCLAPCTGMVDNKEYKDTIRKTVLFLEGKQDEVIREFEQQMKAASENLDFEKAAQLRDQIQSVNSVIEGQRIAAKVSGEQDAIAFSAEKDQAYVQIFFVRGSKLIGRESFMMTGTDKEKPEQIMTGFIKQYYDSASYIPSLLLLQYPIEDKDAIREWLKQKRGGSVNIQVPGKGNKKELIQIVEKNARQGLQQMKLKQLAAPAVLESALQEIKDKLQLPAPPARIEGYDISNIQGREAVGSMVVFENGRAMPSHYRRFRIKTVPSANDYAMMQEVITRRFKRTTTEKEGAQSKSWAILPDLVLIDGGKGQLNMAHRAMVETGAEKISVASLAKENEEIFVPDKKSPVVLPRSSPGLQLLQRVRDESHRFAVSYFTKIHKKKTFTSALDNIPGIGPKRKRDLIKKFGTVKGIKYASTEELMTVKGITSELAERLKEYLG